MNCTQNGVVEFSEKYEEKGSSQKLIDSKLKEIEELKKKLNKLEKVVKGMKGHDKKKNVKSLKLEHPPTRTSLYAAFTSNLSENKPPVAVVVKQEKVKPQAVKRDKPVLKELSPEMVALARRLHQDGYFEKMLYRVKKEFDPNAFSNEYSHSILRSAAEKFGRDHGGYTKWLSGSEMKNVALSGCPSAERNSIYAAKRLRTFFHIQEDIVCRGCNMKSSCQFVNKTVSAGKKKLDLSDAMRVLVTYSLGSTPEMAMSQEVKAYVDKLLQDVINLNNGA